MYAEVTDVKKGESGNPGELHGAFQVSQDMGSLYANTQRGVFGYLTDQGLTQALSRWNWPPGSRSRWARPPSSPISPGIRWRSTRWKFSKSTPTPRTPGTDASGRQTQALEKTGGIVQGMSGSPILQNGKLVGAVTHVLVNDPTRGYGILAENMVSQCVWEEQAQVS